MKNTTYIWVNDKPIIKMLIVALLMLPLSIFAQVEQKPPMLHYEHGFLADYYTLGTKKMTDNELSLHLEKTSPKAYYQYKRSNAHTYIALGFGVAALGFEIWNLTEIVKKPNEQNTTRKYISSMAFLTTAAVGLGFSLSANSKKKKVRDIYNAQYGY